MDQKDKVLDSDKKLILHLVGLEYERLTTDIREERRNLFAWFGLVGAIIGVVIYATLMKWNKPFVSSDSGIMLSDVLLIIVLPLMVVGWIGFAYNFLFNMSNKGRYMEEVLEKKIQRLLGVPLRQWLESSSWWKEQCTEKQETELKKIWGWDSCESSEAFHNDHKAGLRLNKVISFVPVFLALLLPMVLGYSRMLGGKNWEAIIAILQEPMWRFLLITPIVILLVGGVALWIGRTLLEIARNPGRRENDFLSKFWRKVVQ